MSEKGRKMEMDWQVDVRTDRQTCTKTKNKNKSKDR